MSGVLVLGASGIGGELEGLEEEPEAVGEENGRLRSHEHQVDEVIGVVDVTGHIDAAKLWNVEFKIKPLVGIEIRIDPALL